VSVRPPEVDPVKKQRPRTGEGQLPDNLRDRQVLARQVQGAIIHSLNCLELLGLVEVKYPRPKVVVAWLPQPRGLLDLYSDPECPSLPVESPEPIREWKFTSFQQELNRSLQALARSLMPMSEVLSGLKIDTSPWTALAELSGTNVPCGRPRGRNAGLDLLLEDDGYFGIWAGEDADKAIWRKNARRIEKLAGVVRDVYLALDRIERAVGPGVVAERVRVTRADQRCLVALDGETIDLTDVDGADRVFGLLCDADGDFVPGTVIGKAVGLRQFKPDAFKKAVTKISRPLGDLIDSARSKGTRLVLPLPPH
jgi:hypothetical protein